MRLQGVVSNIGWAMLNHLLSRGSMMLATIFLARHFDTREFATYSYFYITSAMLATYAAMGLGTAAAKLFAEQVHASNDCQHTPVIGVLWIGSVLLSILAGGIVFFLPSHWIQAGLDIPRWMLAMGVFVMSLQAIPGGAIQGLGEFRNAALIAMGAAIVMLLGAFAALQMNSIYYAMLALPLSCFLQVLGVSWLVIKRVGLGRLLLYWPIDWRPIKHVLDVVLPLAANGIVAATGMWLLGRIVLSGPGGEHAFALYSIGMQWFALGMFLPLNMGGVFLPRMVKHAVEKSDGRAFLRMAVLAAFASSAFVAIAGAVASPLLLSMYGEQYKVGTWVIAAYMGAAIVTAPVATLGNALIAHGGQWKRLLMMIFWFAILTISAGIARDYLVYGAATALSAAYLCLCSMMLLTARRMKLI